MKRKLLFSFLCFYLCIGYGTAQNQENFEDEPLAQTFFTSNSQVFNITTQAGGTFKIYSVGPGFGWNGTAPDDRYIDNFTTKQNGVPFTLTISSAGAVPFVLKSFYGYLSDYTDALTASGSLTVVGKLNGVTQYTATSSTGFNTTLASQNGFTFINMTTYGGSNNSNKAIDQLVLSSTNNYHYIAIDAFKWAPAFTVASSQTAVSCFGGTNGTASVVASGGTTPYTYSWAPSGGTAATASGLAAGSYTCTITDAALVSYAKVVTISQPASALSATSSKTDVSCNGGSNGTASVVASGGTPSYTYSWAPSGGTSASATGLSVGSYTCTITDANSCTTTKNITITQPTAITASTSQTNLACNGGSNGSASVKAAGGTPAYTYSWAPSGGTAASATGLAAGSYTCTITDANSCTLTKTFTLTQPASALSATSSKTDVSCNGGSNGTASVVASGGTPSYTYSWAPSGGTASTATGLMAGTYTVTITDANSCTTTKTVSISEPTAIVASQTVTICALGHLVVGDSTYTKSGTYTNKLTAISGCDSTLTTILTVEPPVNVTVTIAANVLTSSATGSTYQWIDCIKGNTIIPGETNQSYTALASGSYAVIVTTNKCSDTSACMPVIVTGIDQHAAREQLNVYPNPSNGAFTINSTLAGTYTIINELGQVVRRFQLNNTNNYTTTISELSHGTYYVIGINNNQLVKQKIVVVH